MDAAVPLGLLVTELLSNAYKHAFSPGARSGCIRIEGRTDGTMLTLVVRDDAARSSSSAAKGRALRS